MQQDIFFAKMSRPFDPEFSPTPWTDAATTAHHSGPLKLLSSVPSIEKNEPYETPPYTPPATPRPPHPTVWPSQPEKLRASTTHWLCQCQFLGTSSTTALSISTDDRSQGYLSIDVGRCTYCEELRGRGALAYRLRKTEYRNGANKNRWKPEKVGVFSEINEIDYDSAKDDIDRQVEEQQEMIDAANTLLDIANDRYGCIIVAVDEE
jgi:hypothetical protein